MHLLKNHKILVSPTNNRILDGLKSLGLEVIETQPIGQLIEYERYHADMQLLIIDNTAFISEDSLYLKQYLSKKYDPIVINKLKGKYPGNVQLNIAVVNKKMICKQNAVANEIIEYAKNNSFEIINTNQGYTKCSSLVLNSNALITSDKSIYKAAIGSGIKALLISPGNIYLDGTSSGFIGGASGVVEDKVIFFGDIKKHPDSFKIIDFIYNQGMNHISLNDNILIDVGGLVLIE